MKQRKSIVESIGEIFEDERCCGCLTFPFTFPFFLILSLIALLGKKTVRVSSRGELSVDRQTFEQMFGKRIRFVNEDCEDVDYMICNSLEKFPHGLGLFSNRHTRDSKVMTEEEFKKEMLAKGINARKIISKKVNDDSSEFMSPKNIMSSNSIESKKEPLIQGEGCIWVVLLVIGLIIGAYCFIREKINDWQYERDIAERQEQAKNPRSNKNQKPVVYHYHTCSVCKRRVAEEGGFPNYATWCDSCEKWHCGDCAANCKATDLLLRDYD